MHMQQLLLLAINDPKQHINGTVSWSCHKPSSHSRAA